MCHDDINFAAVMTDVAYITNYLLTASIGGGTFYREVIQESYRYKTVQHSQNPPLADKKQLVIRCGVL